ncbi:uncharacterized protein ACRADG_007306 [Cochliomyia hominivorax]
MARSETKIIKIIFWILFFKSIAVQPFKLDSFKTIDNISQQVPTSRSLYEQYTLGQVEEGAKIIYTYQFTQTYDEDQQEISLDFHYPQEMNENAAEETKGDGDDDDDDSVIITQIQLYVKAEDGAITQAYITEGGIGKNNISLQIIANHSNLLNYMLVIYGKTA